MRHGSLFSGIGGFDLAAEWMGWENVFHCENNKFCQNILKQHWPNIFLHEDITTTDFGIYRGQIDILTGGEPCQPHSIAGKRQGKEDKRYLWPEYKRAIIEIRPKWIVNENVPGSISNGILDEKINDIEAIGYAWWPPIVIPASAVGADHKRERIWLIAHATSDRLERNLSKVELQKTHNVLLKTLVTWNSPGNPFSEWKKLMATPGIFGLSDGFPNRMDRIKAIGNAVVPQVAYEIFKAIESVEKLKLIEIE